MTDIEPPHVVVIVGCYQGESHRQVAQRISSQKQCEAAQAQFVHTEGGAEMFQNLAAMFGHIEFFGPIAEHVVDEPRVITWSEEAFPAVPGEIISKDVTGSRFRETTAASLDPTASMRQAHSWETSGPGHSPGRLKK